MARGGSVRLCRCRANPRISQGPRKAHPMHVNRPLAKTRASAWSALATGVMMLMAPVTSITDSAAASGAVVSVVVDVDFTTATTSGSAIVNGAEGTLANLTPFGSPAGLGSLDGLVFANTTTSNTNQYLTGNLGTTSQMSQVVIELVAKFPDTGCAAQSFGSMVFGFGLTSSSYVPYNIYRHSNFIGFNTFQSELYGISVPNNTDFFSYKFVMVPNSQGFANQEIWVAPVGEPLVKQNLAYRTTNSSTVVSPCSTLPGAAEVSSRRVFSSGSYSNGNFSFMTHPFGPTSWGTTGSVRSLKITTTTGQSAPSAPAISSITSSSGELSVAFSAPSSNGGAAISNYDYSLDNGSNWTTLANPSTASPIVLTGLTDGTTYQVRIRARNSVGPGTASAAVSGTPNAPLAAPGAPTISSIDAGDTQLSVAFTAPVSDGGAAISNYDYSLDNGSDWTPLATPSTTSPIVLTGLTNGTAYEVKIRARNSVGPGVASNAVAATPVAPPPAPAPPSPSVPSVSAPVAPVAPTPPSAEVAGISVRGGNSTNSSIVRITLSKPPAPGERLTVTIRLLDLRGNLIEEIEVPVSSATSSLDVPVEKAIGRFDVEVATSNASSSSRMMSLPTETLKGNTIGLVKGTQTPRLRGKPIANSLVFAPNSFALSAEARKQLRKAARVAKSTNSRIALTGFSAVSGSSDNFERSVAERRAMAASEFLRKRGVSNWMLYQGLSGTEGQQFPGQPRRVEIRVLK